MARLRFDGVTRHFPGADGAAVAAAHLDVADGDVVVVTGAPASGKTTFLRLAAGLELPDEGSVLIGDGSDTAPADAEVAMVFQNYAIYPHISVRDNISLPLRIRGSRARDVSAMVDDVIGLLGLGDLTKRQASALSTSERMRVALARSMVRRPDVLLMDEPLANLEPGVRAELGAQLVTAHQTFRTTTLYAASSPGEAPSVPGRIVRLEDGRLLEE